MLPAHEIENYLLEPAGLAASRLNTLGQGEAQIEGHLRAAAERLTWWAACRQVIAELKRRFRNDFIPDPPRSVENETEAVDCICKSSWFSRLAGEAARSTESDVRQLLIDAHSHSASAITDGRWRAEFAGKEMYRDVGSRICDRTQIHGYRPSPTEFDIDLAKDIARWQYDHGRVPSELADLRSALHARIQGAAKLEAGE